MEVLVAPPGPVFQGLTVQSTGSGLDGQTNVFKEVIEIPLDLNPILSGKGVVPRVEGDFTVALRADSFGETYDVLIDHFIFP